MNRRPDLDPRDLDDHDLDSALRRLDVADHTLDPTQQARRDALLASILTAEPTGAAGVPGPAPASGQARPSGAQPVDELARRRRRRTLRVLVPAAAAAALVSTLVLVNLPGQHAAYASWTPDPTPVTGTARDTAVQACRASFADQPGMAEVPRELRPTTDPATLAPVVAERRGTYLFLALASPDGSTAQCFYDAEHPDRVAGMTGGAATADTPTPQQLPADGYESSGAGMSSGPEGSYAFTVGRVGSGVTAVTVNSDAGPVHATVADGWYAAWWPAEATGPNAPLPTLSYDLTLADGSVRPALPDTMAPSAPAPGPGQVGVVSVGGGAGEDGEVAMLEGVAGPDVRKVTVHAGSDRIDAEVRDGRFSAQWPHPVSQDLGPLTFDLTLADGTVLVGQSPVER